MIIKSFIINNLRNIKSAKIEPAPGLNCFIGDNGAGKTSLLEALVLLSKGRSFRSGQVSALIGPDNKHLQIVTTIRSQLSGSHQLGLERSAEQWVARHNGENVAQLSELTQLLPHVLLEPGSHRLVSGPPKERRRYLDWGVFHVKQGFLSLWRRYNRTLKQRNAALRRSEPDVVESLNPQFVSLGEQLHQAREQYAERLAEILQHQLTQLDATLAGVRLRYRKGWAGNDLEEAIQQSGQHDAERGTTGSGPHRADLYLSLNGVPARERMSRGEQKVLTAAMILTQAQLICASEEKPILLLDDLSSELDEAHFNKVLAAGLSLGVQTWLTGTGQLPSFAAEVEGFAMFHVKQGEVARGVVSTN